MVVLRMTDTGKPHLTRRQFGRAALGLGATAALGAGATAFWRHAKNRRRYEAAVQPGVTGANSLQAHAAAKGLVYGAAVQPRLLDVDGVSRGHSTDGYTQLVAAQADILVDEYTMYWKWLRPSHDRFDFTQVDRLMRFAELTGKQVRGHVLVWHYAMPGWFGGVANKQNARDLLVNHIHTVVGYLKGRIGTWDVVNEAIEPADGRPDGLRNSPWLELIGPDYVELAFRAAAEADPQAKLVYNDYGFEQDTPAPARKRALILALLHRLKDGGVPIHAVGVQSHLFAGGRQPGAGLQSFIREAGKMGLEVQITELDVSLMFMRMKGGVAECDAAVARVYRDYLDLVLAEPNVPLVITWGITDAHTWLRYPWLFFDQFNTRRLWARIIAGLRERPLPFDEDFNPTRAFWALRDALDAAPLREMDKTFSVPARLTGR